MWNSHWSAAKYKWVCLGILLSCVAVASPVGADDQLNIPPERDSAYLPLAFDIIRIINAGGDSQPQRNPMRTLVPMNVGGDEAILIAAYNPRITFDGPAIFSRFSFPTWRINDHAIRLTVNDWQLYSDQMTESQQMAGVGFRRDSAWAFRFDPNNGEREQLFLCNGMDSTGDGRWIPNLQILLVDDYDYDGHHEAFIYVNSQRDMVPRTLYCVDMEALTIEWSLPVASILNEETFFNSGDSTEPTVMFTSYNPKQGVSDSLFHDLYGYLTIVDRTGQPVYHRVIAADHGGMSMARAVVEDQYYLTHEIDLVPPEEFAGNTTGKYRLTRLDRRGEVHASVELNGFPRQTWVAAWGEESLPTVFVKTSEKRVHIFDTELNHLGTSDEVSFGTFIGSIQLSSMEDTLLAFSDGIYDQDLSQVMAFPLPARYVDPVALDDFGRATTLIIGSTDAFAVGVVMPRTFIELLGIFYVSNQEYVLLSLVFLLAALGVVNWFHQKARRRLSETERQLQSVFSSAQDGIAIIQGGAFCFVNDAMADMLGYKAERLVDQALLSRVVLDQRERVDRDLEVLALTNTSVPRRELKFLGAGDVEIELGVSLTRTMYAGRTAALVVARDIREEKRVRAALEASEERFRELADLLPEVVYEADITGRFTFVNRIALEQFGYDEQDIVDGLLIADVIAPRDVARATHYVKNVLKGSDPVPREYMAIRKDGSEFPIVSHASRIMLDGKPAGIRGITINITEQKRTLRALQESEEKYRLLVENVHASIALFDYEGKFLFANQESARVLRRPVDELLTLTQWDVFPKETADRQMATVRRVFTSGTEERIESQSMIEGTLYWNDTSLQPFSDADGKIIAVLVIVQDITKRREAEARLRMLGNAVEQSIDGIAVAKLDGSIFYVNLAWADNHGYQVSELDGVNLSVFHSQKQMTDDVIPFQEQVMKSGAYQGEVGHKRKDGTEFPTWMTTTLFRDEHGNVEGMIGLARDITSQKRADDALRKSEAFNRAIIDNSPLGLSVRSRTGLLLAYNEAWLKMWDMADEELAKALSRERTELMFDESDEYLGDWLPQVRQIYEQGGYLHIPELDLRKSHLQAERWFSQFFYAIMDDSGLVDRVVVLTEDITDRKRVELALTESEERYRSLVEGAGEAIFTLDRDGCFVFANTIAAANMGYTPDQVIGGRLQDLLPEGAVPEALPNLAQVFATKAAVVTDSTLDLGGETRHFRTSLQPILGENGEVKTVLGISRDISLQKQAEEALRKSEAFNRAVIEHSPLSFCVRSRTGSLLTHNEAWYKMWRMDENAPGGIVRPVKFEQEFDELYGYLGERLPDVRRIFREGGYLHIPEVDMRNNRPDDERWFSQFFYAILDDAGQVDRVAILTEDITQRKWTEEQVRLATQEKYQQARDIAGGVSHEIRNALFPARSWLSQLRKLAASGALTDESLVQHTSLIDDSLSRAIEMTNLVSQYTRLESVLEPMPTRVGPVLDQVIAANSARIESMGIELRVGDDMADPIVSNSSHLYIVLNNLLLNALDALTEKGEAGIIEVDYQKTDDGLRLVFSDNGIGIDPANQGRIFDTFFSTKPDTGTGIGLAMTRKITEMYSGKISLKSSPGVGSTFMIDFQPWTSAPADSTEQQGDQ